MEIAYQYRFGLPRIMVWKYINNEKVLKNSLPQCKSFAKTSTGVYLAEIEINLGPIQDLLKLEIQYDKEEALSKSRLKIKGKGSLGQIDGKALLMFKESQGETLLTCRANGDISGALGLAGKRLLDAGAIKGLETFFQQLEREIKRAIYETKRRSG